jgi:predicted DNA-binding protein (UPF0251 family)/predicted Fe-Mo cluster-binding NifX family protein
MPRPPIERAVVGVPRITLFKPAGVPARELEQLRLTVDELEAIRLVDLEGLSHEQAAEGMGVSRQTVGRVLERGRAKVAEALVGGKAILIGGGKYRVAPPCGAADAGSPCGAAAARCSQIDRRSPNESETTMSEETAATARIAVPSEAPGGLDAQRSGHFGRAEYFTMIDVVDGALGEVRVLRNAPHSEGGCMGPVRTLAEQNVTALVVDGIGGRPLSGCNQVGIAVHAGTGNDVRGAVEAFLRGELPLVGLRGTCQH